MATKNISSKVRRALTLLLGMRHPDVARALTPFGFGPAVMQDGLDRLVRANILRLDGTPVEDQKPQLLTRLGEFDSTWFPIARAVLEGAFPAIAAQVFHNLSQEQGREVTLAVAGFLARLEELSAPAGRFGADGAKARALLAARGLTAEVEAEAHACLEALTEIQAADTDHEAEGAAVENVWLWYREWSAIARVAIKQKGLRRKLGFLKRRPADEEEVVAPAVPEGTTPAVVVPAAMTPAVAPPALPPVVTPPPAALPAPLALGPIAAE